MQQARGDSLVQLTENHETIDSEIFRTDSICQMDISTAPMNQLGMETALLLYTENTLNQEILCVRG